MSAPGNVIVFCDTETTGLDSERHEIWEVGLIDRSGYEHEWTLTVDLGRADAMALKISGFHDRYWRKDKTRIADFAETFRELTNDCHLAGAVISFDEERLRQLLRAHHECPMWHYHLVDVESLAAGKLGLGPPWDSDELSRQVGVDPDDFDRHSALGDARWAKAIYDAVVT
jgi:DNA polymerase III epsilon subunit-like protein